MSGDTQIMGYFNEDSLDKDIKFLAMENYSLSRLHLTPQNAHYSPLRLVHVLKNKILPAIYYHPFKERPISDLNSRTAILVHFRASSCYQPTADTSPV